MAYSVTKGKVDGLDVPPEEEKEDEPDPHSVEVPTGNYCPHGYYTKYACYQCNPKKYLPVAGSLYNDVFAWTNLKIGDMVCRRIRPDEKGVVTNITYVFTDSLHMREVWVDFCPPNGRSTPYKPDELLTVKVQ